MTNLLSTISRFVWIPSSRSPAGITQVGAIPSLFIVALGIYWWYTYSGPYQWLAEIQLSMFGAYGAFITGILSCLLLLIPTVFLGSYVESRGLLNADSFRTYDPKQYEVPIGIMTLAVMVLAAGWFVFQRLPQGTPVELTLREIARGVDIPKHVSLQGNAATQHSLRQDGDYGRPSYTPLVGGNYEEGDAVFVYVENYPRDNAALARSKHRGTLIRNGLPGVVREAFMSSSTPPAPNYFVLHYANGMKGLEFLPKILFTIAGVLGLASLAMFCIIHMRTPH